MVIKGLKRITNFGIASEKLFTHYGILTRIEWLKKEAKRFKNGQVIKNHKSEVALFVKGEENDTEDQTVDVLQEES